MFINITDGGETKNKGSSAALVHYLEKENRLQKKEVQERWFNAVRQDILASEVYRSLDGNVAKLGRNDAKFFLVNISPSGKELKFLLDKFGREGAKNELKKFAALVMDEYARNFKRDGITGQENLLWFGKTEDFRYYSHLDKLVKKGEKKSGEQKEGEQMHIQVVVSRKDATNRVKLSPNNTSRGKNAEHSKKMGQFDRLAFSQSGERVFDGHFGFDRKLTDSLKFSVAMKNGSLAERMEMTSLSKLDVDVDAHFNRNQVLENLPSLSAAENTELETIDYVPLLDAFSIDISDDIDDEAILGRNRHRKRKARTNTR